MIDIQQLTSLISAFRGEVMLIITDLTVATFHHTRVIEKLRQIIVTALHGNQEPEWSLRDIIDLMQKNETSFSHSPTQAPTPKLFEPLVFENKKKAN